MTLQIKDANIAGKFGRINKKSLKKGKIRMSEDYQKAKRLGERAYRKAVARGQYPYLPALNEIVEDLESLQRVDIGHTEIPLSMIVGTKTAGRQNAFACNFMPLLDDYTEFALKWERLYESQMEEGIREPIQVLEYMKRFYVVEGNKRVSIMNFVGMHSASAQVVRLLPEKSEDPEVKLYYEFTEFYKAAPIYDITFSKPGYYHQFAELLGQDLNHKWDEDLLRRIRSALIYFEKIFYNKGGRSLGIPSGDALLAYMRIYPLKSIMEDSAAMLESRMSRLWKEFVTESRSIDLVEHPEDESRNALTAPIKGIFQKHFSAANPLAVAFMYERSPEHSSWLYGHSLGQNAVEDAFDGVVRTKAYEPENENDTLRDMIDRAVADGSRTIFTLTSRQMDDTLRSAIHFPNVTFLNCSVNLSHNAVRTYYARMYEAKFIMGALAAMMADNHRIGYVADMPVYGTIANINAFAVGASLVDPAARIHLKWHMQEGTDWEQELLKEDVRLISGRDYIRPDHACRKYGLFRVQEDGSVENLAAPVIDWGRYYCRMLQSMLDTGLDAPSAQKSGQTVSYWWGMSAGVVDVIPSAKLPYSAKKMMNLLKNAIIEGHLSPFEGELRAADRIISEEGAGPLSASSIITMDWLNDNIIGKIPDAGMMNEDARGTMNVIGVEPRK